MIPRGMPTLPSSSALLFMIEEASICSGENLASTDVVPNRTFGMADSRCEIIRSSCFARSLLSLEEVASDIPERVLRQILNLP